MIGHWIAVGGGDLPGWAIPGASVMVALIGAVALLVVRRVRGPVTIQDLWKENRQLRTDLEKTDAKVEALMRSQQTQITINRVMGEGFDALSGGVERMSVKPTFTPVEHDAISRARALRQDDLIWATLQPPEIQPTRNGAQP